MTLITDTTQKDGDDPRAAYARGLRALADALEKNPEDLPLPYEGTRTEIAMTFLFSEDPRGDLAAAARAIPGVKWAKSTRESAEYGNYFDLKGKLHGLALRLTAYREAVCERVVIGTREVTELVKDPEALAAVPVVEVTREEDVVEWRCQPVMAGSPAGAEAGEAA